MAARYLLWSELADTLDMDCRWVLAGDWNFVEEAQDKSQNNNYIMSAEEHGIFEVLKLTLGIRDAFPASSRIRYTYANKRGITREHLQD